MFLKNLSILMLTFSQNNIQGKLLNVQMPLKFFYVILQKKIHQNYINGRFHCVRPWATFSRRNAVYIKEVTPDSTKSKPPLPTAASEAAHQVPKPPPRSRPKSWTSTLFNAMRNNHRSVTFQCVDEENHVNVSSEVIVASDPTMPIAAASSSEGQKFYSLPRPNARSRTPSPFRSMIKGLVKGKTKIFKKKKNQFLKIL